MLSRRSLELRPDLPGLPQALITREDLIDCGLARQVLAQAHARADEILSNAQAASEALLKKAHDEFWLQANAQLERWQQQHSALCPVPRHRVERIAGGQSGLATTAR